MPKRLSVPFITIHSEGVDKMDALAIVMEKTGLQVDAIYIIRDQVERIPEVGKEKDERKASV